MATTCIIGTKEISVIRVKRSEKQRQIPEFEVSVTTLDLIGLGDIYLEDIALYQDGELLISGIIRSPSPPPKFERGSSQRLQTTLKCDGEIGRLQCETAANIHFQNVAVSAAITALLATALDSMWALGDTTTLSDIQITIDPRSHQTLWPQIIDVLEASRFPTFFRYGGNSGGTHLLDIGTFDGQDPSFYVRQENQLSPLRLKEPSREPIKRLYPVSGPSSTQPVALSNALNIDPTLATHPDFPLHAASGSIINNTISRGCQLRKEFKIHKPQNDLNASQAVKNEVAISLYRRGVFEMEQSAPYYSGDVTVVLPRPPKINEKIFADTLVHEEDYDFLTEQVHLVESFRLQEWMRIVGFKSDHRERSIEYEDYLETQGGFLTVYDLELTSADIADEYDPLLTVYDDVKTYDTFDDNSTIIQNVVGSVQIQAQLSQGPGLAANCNYAGVNTGRLFSFPMPTVPPGATSVTAYVQIVNPSNVFYVVTQNPALPATPFQICASAAGGGNWGVGSQATITVAYIFYF
jgi:hypothetical protein